jgi:hypothetical protein
MRRVRESAAHAEQNAAPIRFPGMKRQRTLRVFTTRIGFHDVIVAATSQKDALRLWGASCDLFARGRAYETRVSVETKAAFAAPGEVLARPIGSAKPYRFVAARPREIENAASVKR